MGTLSYAPDRAAQTAAIIATEDEAVTVAGTISGIFALPAENEASAKARLDLLSRSGLFGISVPTEHGGIDVSNTVLAEVCALAADRSPALGEILAAHFVAAEEIRGHGSESQSSTVFSAILAGARLARASVRRGQTADSFSLASGGLAWRLGGEAFCTPCARHADWLLVPVHHEGTKVTHLLLPARGEGLHYVANSRTPAAEHVLFKDVLAEGDALIQTAGEPSPHEVRRSLELLLEAARALGAGRHALQRLLDDTDGDALTAGLLSARLAAAEAMVAEAGRAIDAAQIGLAGQHRTNAFLAAVAALTVTEEAASAIAGTPATPPAHLAAILSESGELRRQARRPQEED